MPAFLDLLRSKPSALWLECHDYCARLLAGGSAPLLDAAGYVAWQRKAQGLLRADVLALPLAPVIAAWLGAQPGLREAMAAKSRTVFALKTLLADEGLRAHLLELVQGTRAAIAAVPLALVLPSPRAWVAVAYEQAHGSSAEVGEDEADSAAVFIADFLRVFGEAGVDALLLQEPANFAPAAAADFACCQSVFNVAGHYRWDVGVQLHGNAAALPGECVFAIAPQAIAGTATGIAVADAFWAGTAPIHAGAFHYACVPCDAQPEAVLERLAILRGLPQA